MTNPKIQFNKILFILLLLIVFSLTLIFNYAIRTQDKLDMDELNEMVEKEMQETHGKN
jgi:hypothetical protein